MLLFLELGSSAWDNINRNTQAAHEGPCSNWIKLLLGRAVREDSKKIVVTRRACTRLSPATEEPYLFGVQVRDEPLQHGTQPFELSRGQGHR